MTEEAILRAIAQKRIDSLEGALRDMPEEQQRTCMRFFLNGLGFYSSSDLTERGITLSKEEQRSYYELQDQHVREMLEDIILTRYVLRKLNELGMKQEEERIKWRTTSYSDELRRMSEDS